MSGNFWDRDSSFLKGKTGVDGAGDPTGELIQGILDGSFYRLAVDAKLDADVLSGSVRDFYTEVGKGNIPGHLFESKFGYNPACKNNNFEVIWDNGDGYTYATSAQKVNIFSSSLKDDSVGTGARTIEIIGLDGNHDPLSETITMDGTSNVESIYSYLRIFRMLVLTAGSGGQNDGDICAEQVTSSILMAKILEENTQTLMAVYTVRAGYTGFITRWFYTLRTGKNTTLKCLIKPFEGVFNTKLLVDTDASEQQVYTSPLIVTEKSDIQIVARASTGSHAVAAGFDILLVDNDLL